MKVFEIFRLHTLKALSNTESFANIIFEQQGCPTRNRWELGERLEECLKRKVETQPVYFDVFTLRFQLITFYDAFL